MALPRTDTAILKLETALQKRDVSLFLKVLLDLIETKEIQSLSPSTLEKTNIYNKIKDKIQHHFPLDDLAMDPRVIHIKNIWKILALENFNAQLMEYLYEQDLTPLVYSESSGTYWRNIVKKLLFEDFVKAIRSENLVRLTKFIEKYQSKLPNNDIFTDEYFTDDYVTLKEKIEDMLLKMEISIAFYNKCIPVLAHIGIDLLPKEVEAEVNPVTESGLRRRRSHHPDLHLHAHRHHGDYDHTHRHNIFKKK